MCNLARLHLDDFCASKKGLCSTELLTVEKQLRRMVEEYGLHMDIKLSILSVEI